LFDGEEGTMPKQIDSSVLEMALIGFEAEIQKITARISAIRKRLGARAQRITQGPKPKRVLSAAAKKKIADAQKKRWAEYHAKHKAPANPARRQDPNGSFSPAAKAKLVANLAKARAARAANKAAA
jgi:hypothetical protein